MKNIFLLLCLTIASALIAQTLPVEDAQAVARFQSYLKSGEYREIKEYTEISVENYGTVGYLFLLEPTGYVAVSNNYRVRPVIAWSMNNTANIQPPGNVLLPMLKMDMPNRILNIPNLTIEQVQENETLWTRYLAEDEALVLRELDADEPYGPWLQTHWSQSYPYNMYCPEDPSVGERCVTGCVQTASSMIMNYWNYPYSQSFTESDSYWSTRTTPDIYIDATTANLPEMIYTRENSPDPSSDMIARMMFANGVTVRADYSYEATSADIREEHYLHKWGFISAEGQILYNPEFFSILERNMIEGKPCQMSIAGEEGGHSINVDGVNDDTEFHLNMGWGGTDDGWYDLSRGGPDGFRFIGETIMDIVAPPKPDFPNIAVAGNRIYPRDNWQKVLNGFDTDGDQDWICFHACPDSYYVFYTTGPHDLNFEIYEVAGDLICHVDTGEVHGNIRYTYRPEMDRDYYLRIAADDRVEDTNYQLFYQKTSAPDYPSLSIIMPNGGETYIGGEEISVFWNRGGEPWITYCKVEYSLEGREGPWQTIADSVTGSFVRWECPEVEEDKWAVYVRVSDNSNAIIYDTNDRGFRIRDPESIDESITPEYKTLSVYPNPFNSSVEINIAENSNGQISIFDIFGVKVDELLTTTNNAIWQPGSEIGSGVYIIQSGNETERVIYSK